MSSLELLKKFLIQYNINIDVSEYLDTVEYNSSLSENLKPAIIESIINEAYQCTNNYIKQLNKSLINNFGINLNRYQKTLAKKYSIYKDPVFIEKLCNSIEGVQRLDNQTDLLFQNENKSNISKFIENFAEENKDLICSGVNEYILNLKNAIKHQNTSRIYDYLNFIYSRLLSLNELKYISPNFLLEREEKILKHELSEKELFKLKNIFQSDKLSYHADVVDNFLEAYFEVTDRTLKQNYDLIFLEIDQKLFDDLVTKENFYGQLFNLIKDTYEKITNHRYLVIKINNIFLKSVNIKWQIYSKLILFAENFQEIEIRDNYYQPQKIFIDYFSHKFNVIIESHDETILKEYFKNKITYDELITKLKFNVEKNELDSFRKVYKGYNFEDCFILRTDSSPNSKDINFISNQNELLLTFSLNKIDKKKIPCPMCGSLKVSGNSYSEIGLKSWECKNSLCSERSKTNRGKRYSRKSIMMQKSLQDFSPFDLISKELIKIWRRDIVSNWNNSLLYEMLIKYFSYKNDNILAINPGDKKLIKKISSDLKRKIEIKSISKIKSYTPDATKTYLKFINNNKALKRIIYSRQKRSQISKNIKRINQSQSQLIFGDSTNIEYYLRENSVDLFVTSPPYYNAREYSTWVNLSTYLNDMYKIAKGCFKTQKKGGIYFYNIGDTFDNENTIVKSTMGNKRIALGAYSIFIFEQAGYQLLDNIIWDKGEPQTKRHQNDGNNTPFYQKPAMCYEHMFLFKKPGKIRLNNERKDIKSNIQKFSPVIKINSKGENIYGHTAPFPPKLPLLAILTFSKIGDLIVDPFSGSGTTIIQAIIENRIGIGFEISKEYLKLTKNLAKSYHIDLALTT